MRGLLPKRRQRAEETSCLSQCGSYSRSMQAWIPPGRPKRSGHGAAEGFAKKLADLGDGIRIDPWA